MFSKINSIYLLGMEGKNVTVEADVSDGLPGLSLWDIWPRRSGRAETGVRTAIKNLGLSLPPKKITVNLSPADFRKEGTGFDLAIAAAILSSYGGFQAKDLEDAVFFGELGLDGTVRGIPGVMALTAQARESGFRRVFLPAENVKEASFIGGISLYGVRDLKHLVDMLSGKQPMRPEPPVNMKELQDTMNRYDVDFAELSGQPLLRRAAEVAAAGKHNLLVVGPAGAGKTMLARRMPTIMPGMDVAESIEISKIYSVSGLLTEKEPLVKIRPFRAPHHTVSVQALTGAGETKPGEMSLATGGILFLVNCRSFPERHSRHSGQPLEDREVTVSRVEATVTYPANFQLVAAMNPCPAVIFRTLRGAGARRDRSRGIYRRYRDHCWTGSISVWRHPRLLTGTSEAAEKMKLPARSGRGWSRQERSRKSGLWRKTSAATGRWRGGISGNTAFWGRRRRPLWRRSSKSLRFPPECMTGS